MLDKEYLVTWEINVTAPSPEDAAWQAKEIQQRLNSWANVFVVKDETTGEQVKIDLDE